MFHTNAPNGARGRVARTSLMNGLGSVIYAARLDDGVIKIGHTESLGNRLKMLKNYTRCDVELLAFRFGTRDQETALHLELFTHRAQRVKYANAREYYEPDAVVMAIVGSMRADLGFVDEQVISRTG